MSHRLCLYDEPQAWANVNRADHLSMEDAILAFVDWRQAPYFKIIGRPRQVASCKKTWRSLQAAGHTLPEVADVTWIGTGLRYRLRHMFLMLLEKLRAGRKRVAEGKG